MTRLCLFPALLESRTIRVGQRISQVSNVIMDEMTHAKITLRHLGDKAEEMTEPISGNLIRKLRDIPMLLVHYHASAYSQRSAAPRQKP